MHISSHLTSHDHRVMLATKVNYCIPEGVFTSPLWDKRSEMEITMENENKQQTPHKRRVRYKGKYPKRFEEKYKELNPEKYQDTIEHVIRKGNTPAGMHISIMVPEIIDFLQIKPGQTGFDATLGYGGHTRAMLEQLNGEGHMYATDVDPEESAKTRKRLADLGFGEDILTIKLQNFCTIDEIAREAGGFDFLLADLGVSSMQIDDPARGFSYMHDAPLDMRMDNRQEVTAATVVNEYTESELFQVIRKYGEDKFAKNIAKHIVQERRKEPVMTTGRLAQIVDQSIPMKFKKQGGHPAKRTFQAIRIEVNRELSVLEDHISEMIDLLAPGGRFCIITFHSLEDRIVKNAFRTAQDPCTCPPNFPVCVCGKKSKGKVLTRKPVLPSEKELEENSRSKSAKLRVFEHI